MPFTRPTLVKLIERSQGDIETRLPGADARIRNSTEAVLARATSGGVHGLHGHLVWNSRQIMPDTAEAENMVRHADIYGIQKNAAVKATGSSITITGVDTTVCPLGTLWQTVDEVVYVQDAEVTISGGSATIALTAQTAGADGNQSVGTTVSLVSPVTGIATDATVGGSGLTGGLDETTDEALLVRLLSRIRTPPKGGGPGDYVNWALEVSGCTRAWQYPNVDGLGTVAVRFVQDDDPVSILPSAEEIATMQSYLESKAPVTATVTTYAPTQKLLDITLTSLTYTGLLADVKAAIIAELEDLILRNGNPGDTVLLSQINEAISLAAGETDHVMTIPAADVTHTAGEMPKLGTITWPP